MVLGLLVLFVLLEMLMPSMWLFLQQSNISQAQQQAAVAIDQIKLGFFNTIPETISVLPTQVAVGWQPVDPTLPFDSQGVPRLQPCFMVFTWDGSRLWRCQCAPATHTYAPPTPLLPGEFPTPNGPGTVSHVLAFNVSQFVVGALGSAGQVAYPLPVAITINVPGTRKITQWTMRTQLNPHMSLAPPDNITP